jgi:ribonuclease-3
LKASQVVNVSDLFHLQQEIGVFFRDPLLLDQALVHSSYVNENPDAAPSSYERMEFLGDAVLGLVIAEKLYKDLPESAEGELTRLRSALVRRETLANIAESIGLGEYLHLGKGEEAGGGRNKLVNLAGAFESLIAAIFFDQGLEAARNFILKVFGPEIYKLAHISAGADYKSQLQEIMQARKQMTPVYHLVSAAGPDHDRLFTVEVKAGDTILGRGQGKNKKAAETEAARAALMSLTGL